MRIQSPEKAKRQWWVQREKSVSEQGSCVKESGGLGWPLGTSCHFPRKLSDKCFKSPETVLIVSSEGKCTSSVGNLEGWYPASRSQLSTETTVSLDKANLHWAGTLSRHWQTLTMHGPSSSSQHWPHPGILWPWSTGFDLARWHVGPVRTAWLCNVVTGAL